MTYYDTLGVRKTASAQDIKVFIIKNSVYIPFCSESLPETRAWISPWQKQRLP